MLVRFVYAVILTCCFVFDLFMLFGLALTFLKGDFVLLIWMVCLNAVDWLLWYGVLILL